MVSDSRPGRADGRTDGETGHASYMTSAGAEAYEPLPYMYTERRLAVSMNVCIIYRYSKPAINTNRRQLISELRVCVR